MSFCSFTKGISPKICWFCLVPINSVLLNLLCVWILFQNASRPVILVTDFFPQLLCCAVSYRSFLLLFGDLCFQSGARVVVCLFVIVVLFVCFLFFCFLTVGLLLLERFIFCFLLLLFACLLLLLFWSRG